MKVNNLAQVVRQMSKFLLSVLVDSEGRSKIFNRLKCLKYPFKVKLYLKILTRYFLILIMSFLLLVHLQRDLDE